MQDLRASVEQLLAMPPYSLSNEDKTPLLLSVLKDELEYACSRHAGFRNYVEHWPTDYRAATRISDLPFLPVGSLKAVPPLRLVEENEIKRTLASSATTGQSPSRVVLDSSTARRMTKSVAAIVQDFIGSTRRPYLVVDVPESGQTRNELGARGAAIQGLLPFATDVTYCLVPSPRGAYTLDLDKLLQFASDRRDAPVLIYGFTSILWKHLVEPLMSEHISLNLANVHVLHSGGWKRLQDEAVEKRHFNEALASVVGCSQDRVIDFYGMVENAGVIYPDCQAGNKHVPVFADVLIRNPQTLEPCVEGERGIVQVCSVLPASFPGYLLITEDMAEIMAFDGCPCGRRGTCFRFAGRVPKAEIRGCGNIEIRR